MASTSLQPVYLSVILPTVKGGTGADELNWICVFVQLGLVVLASVDER